LPGQYSSKDAPHKLLITPVVGNAPVEGQNGERFETGLHALIAVCPNSVSVLPSPREGKMAKENKTEFYYYIDGKPYLLTVGENGITEEIITVLRDSYNYERLNDRYQGELEDKRCEFAKNLITTNSVQSPTDPIENLTSHHISPEEALFSKEVDPTLRDKVHTLIAHLIPSQQELFWQLSEGRRLVDIARDEGTTDNAIRSRRRKMFARIKALYEETYGNK
jgi:hypothetical protein